MPDRMKPKTVQVMWSIPHYRIPIFRRLSGNPYLDFTVCAGDNKRVFGGSTLATGRDVGAIAGVHWKCVKSSRVKGPILRDYEWQPGAVRMAWKDDIDVVICQGNKSISNWLIRIILKIRGIPLIEWTQGVREAERGVKWAIRKFYMKWAKAHLLYGNFAKDFYISHGFRDEEVFVVYNSLDYDRQVAIREQITASDVRQTRAEFAVSAPDDRLIVHSGRLEERKNLRLLLDALKNLKRSGSRIVLVLVGDGQSEQDLRAYARDQDLSDQVVFLGPCYDESRLGCLFVASDLCVVPGAVGLIAMHSFVYGTPILTCDKTKWLHGPEVETVVEGRTGGFFRDGDVSHLVEKMRTMLYPVPCKPSMAKACMEVIDRYYNPAYQEQVIINAINYVLPPEKRIPGPVVKMGYDVSNSNERSDL